MHPHTHATALQPSSAGPRASLRDALAVLATAVLSLGVLWFGSGVASSLATSAVTGSPQTHAALASRAQETRPASYGELFTYVIAPVRTDAASSIRSIRIEARDLLPLRWGWGYL